MLAGLTCPCLSCCALRRWMPPNSISSPHYHANAVESGTVVKGAPAVPAGLCLLGPACM